MQFSLARPAASQGALDKARFVLGALWLLDGLLQLQPYMLTSAFAHNVIAPAASGQPGWVAGGVLWSARLMAHQPVLADAGFAAAQIGIGVAVLWRRTARAALLASMAWALGVWYFGEGLGGVTSGNANILTGAPGAVLLYLVAGAVLLLVAGGRSRAASRAAAGAWAATWALGAALSVADNQYAPRAEEATARQAYSLAPNALSGADHAIWHLLASGPGPGLALVGAELAIAAAALAGPGARRASAWSGTGLALALWVFGEGFGALWSGSATDPNSGPPLALLALLLAATSARRPAAATNALPAHGQLRGSVVSPAAQTRAA